MLNNLYDSPFIRNALIHLIIKWITPLHDYLKYRIYPDKFFLKIKFKKNLGYTLNLENPITFNEKMQWLKLNLRSKLLTKCADKLLVREYVSTVVGEEYLIPLYLWTYNPVSFNKEDLPKYPFIIKANHNSSGGLGGLIFLIKTK